jgi:hypothetical protein
MTRLLVSSGNGPAETSLAVGHILRLMADNSTVGVVESSAVRVVHLPNGLTGVRFKEQL